MSVHIGIELTFIPNLSGRRKEFLRRSDCRAAVGVLNALLRSDLKTRLFKAHVEVLHRKTWQHDVDSWCVEVTHPAINAESFLYDYSDNRERFELLYAHAYSLNLHPRIEWMRRDGTTVFAAGGGSHLHLGMNLFEESCHNLSRLHHFERLVALDFVQRPYIRWLFACHYDDLNSRPCNTWSYLDNDPDTSLTRDAIDRLVTDVQVTSNISPRWSSDSKRIYASWENRFFTDMPATYDELRFHVSFLTRWTDYFVNGLTETDPVAFIAEHQRFSLTEDSFNQLVTDESYLVDEMTAFFTRIGLDYAPQLDTLYRRNLVNRLAYGLTRSPKTVPESAGMTTTTPYITLSFTSTSPTVVDTPVLA